MAEYNILYLELTKRLSILKAKLPYLDSLTDSKREEYQREIDSLLKKLDDRYSNSRYLDDIEFDVSQLEQLL